MDWTILLRDQDEVLPWPWTNLLRVEGLSSAKSNVVLVNHANDERWDFDKPSDVKETNDLDDHLVEPAIPLGALRVGDRGPSVVRVVDLATELSHVGELLFSGWGMLVAMGHRRRWHANSGCVARDTSSRYQ